MGTTKRTMMMIMMVTKNDNNNDNDDDHDGIKATPLLWCQKEWDAVTPRSEEESRSEHLISEIS